MKIFAIAVLAGVGALSVGSARASDIVTTSEGFNPDLVQQVRLVCDDAGRCYRTRGGRRVVIQEYGDSYNYAPRERYIERRGYEERGPSVGFRAPGVSIGVGGDRY